MNVTTERTKGFTVIQPLGAVQRETADEILEEIGRVVDQDVKRIVLDLSRADTVDSHGLSCMISAVTRARLREADVVLVGPRPFVIGLLQVTRLDQWFDVFESMADVERRFADN